MFTYKRLIILLLAFSTIWSCTKDFEQTNINPTTAVDVQPDFLMRKVWYDYLDNMAFEGFVAGNLLGQYFTAIDFNLFDRHSLSEPQYGGKPWNFIYENLRDNEILLAKAKNNPAFAVYEGPTLVFKAYATMALTDLYGDVPYSEALKGQAGITSPAYDTQQDIYQKENGIVALLQQAVVVMEAYNGAIKLQGDIIYNGNLQKWIKLANSLQLKALMRISNVVDVKQALNSLSNQPLITSADDNAFYNFTQGPPNNFRMSTAKVGDYNLFMMSATIDSILTTLNDPRKTKYFRPTAADANVYKGLLNGPDASKLSISTSNYSLTGRIFREEAAQLKAVVMNSAETAFLLAEAASRGYISGKAEDWYQVGIQQSFAYWNIALSSDYMNQPKVIFNPTNGLEQIISQKWINNIMNGYEGWIEYRRTGYPALKTVSASLNNQLIPVRMPYPASEAALNGEQYQKVAVNTSNNSINVPVWWDK